MSSGKKKERKKSKLLEERNRIRGVIANSKDVSYSKIPKNPAARFQRLLSDALIESRQNIGTQGERGFLAWAEQLAAALVPHLASAPKDSQLSARTDDRTPRSLTNELRWMLRRLETNSDELREFRSNSLLKKPE